MTMTKKLYVLLIISVLLLNIVLAQTTPVNSNIENIIVKEHFLTKKELKDEMATQSKICLEGSDIMIANAFKEFEVVISDNINKFLFKISLVIISVFTFAGATWYFIRLKLDKRLERLRAIRTKVEELDQETNKQPETSDKPLETLEKEGLADKLQTYVTKK